MYRFANAMCDLKVFCPRLNEAGVLCKCTNAKAPLQSENGIPYAVHLN